MQDTFSIRSFNFTGCSTRVTHSTNTKLQDKFCWVTGVFPRFHRLHVFSHFARAHVLLRLTPIACFPALGTGLRVWFLFSLNYDCLFAFVGFILIGPMRCGLPWTGFFGSQ